MKKTYKEEGSKEAQIDEVWRKDMDALEIGDSFGLEQWVGVFQ